MTLVIITKILSRRDFGSIVAGRIAGDHSRAGTPIRVKMNRSALIGEPAIGESWTFEGDLEASKWGPQIVATRAVRALPTGKMMIDFLAHSTAGIGRVRANRLWAAFEDRLPEALESGDVQAIAEAMEPTRPVLAPRLAVAAISAWKELAGQSRLLEWLAAVGLTDVNLAPRLHALLGDDAPARLQANPWCLVPLMSWRRVDALGLRLLRESGEVFPERHPNRLVGAADAVIKDTIADGSTAITPGDFWQRLSQKLTRPDLVARAVDLSLARRAVVPSANGVFRAPGCACMEDAVLAKLRKMAQQAPDPAMHNKLAALLKKKHALHPEQAEALGKVLSLGFACLGGGAGTGKTHVARAICEIWETLGGRLLLAAVAGKAALRLSRATARRARTLFRTIRELDRREDEAKHATCLRRLANLATADSRTLVVIDEASMVDLPSMHGLLRRLPSGARILLIGDEGQLAPVGFGLLFHHFVQEPSITARLTIIHRQQNESEIPQVAAMLRRCQVPSLRNYNGDCDGVSIAEVGGREAIAATVMKIRRQIADQAGSLFIVSPVNESACGVLSLNRLLHDAYVRDTGLPELRGALGDIFSRGEPVVHTRNDYDRGLFNGSFGSILEIAPSDCTLRAVFDDTEQVFQKDELVALSLGYTLTCHRAQGSEADRVVIALPDSRVLDPAWLYTAVTRAKRQAVIVGTRETLRKVLCLPWASNRRLTGIANFWRD